MYQILSGANLSCHENCISGDITEAEKKASVRWMTRYEK